MSAVWACIQIALILPDTFQTTALHRQDLDEDQPAGGYTRPLHSASQYQMRIIIPTAWFGGKTNDQGEGESEWKGIPR